MSLSLDEHVCVHGLSKEVYEVQLNISQLNTHCISHYHWRTLRIWITGDQAVMSSHICRMWTNCGACSTSCISTDTESHAGNNISIVNMITAHQGIEDYEHR